MADWRSPCSLSIRVEITKNEVSDSITTQTTEIATRTSTMVKPSSRAARDAGTPRLLSTVD